MILCNNMEERLYRTLELEHGTDTIYYDENWEEISSEKYYILTNKGKVTHKEPIEIYQYYIISKYGADILKTYTNEMLFYDNELDLYVWGVAHTGTSWNYVFTDIEIKREEN